MDGGRSFEPGGAMIAGPVVDGGRSFERLVAA
jgi:hypothetical protein